LTTYGYIVLGFALLGFGFGAFISFVDVHLLRVISLRFALLGLLWRGGGCGRGSQIFLKLLKNVFVIVDGVVLGSEIKGGP
jgi:hypothetical protein